MILALDVGFAHTGWSVFNEIGHVIGCGCLTTEKSEKKTTRTADDYYARAGRLASGLKEVIEMHSIHAIVGELPSGGAQSAKAMAMMNMATSIVASVAALLDMPCEWCTPNDVKLAVSGYRSATKKEMMDNIRSKFEGKGAHLFPKQLGQFEHIADSAGAYLALRDGNLIRMFKKTVQEAA